MWTPGNDDGVSRESIEGNLAKSEKVNEEYDDFSISLYNKMSASEREYLDKVEDAGGWKRNLEDLESVKEFGNRQKEVTFRPPKLSARERFKTLGSFVLFGLAIPIVVILGILALGVIALIMTLLINSPTFGY